jgi:hypothetical protein
MHRAAILLAISLGIPSVSIGATIPDAWLLWSHDTHFRDRQPAAQWRREAWVTRAGPFDTRQACDRRMEEALDSAGHSLGDGYRVTARLETALVARGQDGLSGLRRRYVCLPGDVAPPK